MPSSVSDFVLVGAHNSIIQTVDQVGLPLDEGNYDCQDACTSQCIPVGHGYDIPFDIQY